MTTNLIQPNSLWLYVETDSLYHIIDSSPGHVIALEVSKQNSDPEKPLKLVSGHPSNFLKKFCLFKI